MFLVLFFGYVFIFVISSYSELRRAGFSANMGRTEIEFSAEMAPEVLPDLVKSIKGAVPLTYEFSELQEYPSRGVWHMLKRLSVTSWAATSMKLVELSGYKSESMVGAILHSVTPRIFFPDKKTISWGKDVAVELGQARTYATAKSAMQTAIDMR